uniref:TAXi_C domain-containing protein n=1 Tax=Macrostomum lignano TaxID=282301 RepID=A0A1I8FDG4_9PLAT
EALGSFSYSTTSDVAPGTRACSPIAAHNSVGPSTATLSLAGNQFRGPAGTTAPLFQGSDGGVWLPGHQPMNGTLVNGRRDSLATWPELRQDDRHHCAVRCPANSTLDSLNDIGAAGAFPVLFGVRRAVPTYQLHPGWRTPPHLRHVCRHAGYQPPDPQQRVAAVCELPARARRLWTAVPIWTILRGSRCLQLHADNQRPSLLCQCCWQSLPRRAGPTRPARPRIADFQCALLCQRLLLPTLTAGLRRGPAASRCLDRIRGFQHSAGRCVLEDVVNGKPV